MAKDKVKATTKTQSTETAPRVMRNEAVGIVVSDKMQKTVTVQVFTLNRHAKYGKFLRQSSIFKAHDEKSEAKMGDTVRIFQSRPYSKTKRWVMTEIVEKKKQVEGVDI
jgi:small subunit ribosomal protein S17